MGSFDQTFRTVIPYPRGKLTHQGSRGAREELLTPVRGHSRQEQGSRNPHHSQASKDLLLSRSLWAQLCQQTVAGCATGAPCRVQAFSQRSAAEQCARTAWQDCSLARTRQHRFQSTTARG